MDRTSRLGHAADYRDAASAREPSGGAGDRNSTGCASVQPASLLTVSYRKNGEQARRLHEELRWRTRRRALTRDTRNVATDLMRQRQVGELEGDADFLDAGGEGDLEFLRLAGA